jgi:F-type H+-transporting ATPase subunit gamma
MKTLAASSIGQYEQAVRALDSYVASVRLGLGACLRASPEFQRTIGGHAARPAVSIVIVFGSDQGLVGSFNESLTAYTLGSMVDLHATDAMVWAIGERAAALMSDAPGRQVKTINAATSIAGVATLVGQLLIDIEHVRETTPSVAVVLFHNRPSGGAIYSPCKLTLLPFDQKWQDQMLSVPWPSRALPDMVGGADLLLPALIDAYLFVMLYTAAAESLASENASRLAAMQRAEKNIDTLLENMARQYHRIRQEGIDEELFDVISGFDAASGASRPGVPAQAV